MQAQTYQARSRFLTHVHVRLQPCVDLHRYNKDLAAGQLNADCGLTNEAEQPTSGFTVLKATESSLV